MMIPMTSSKTNRMARIMAAISPVDNDEDAPVDAPRPGSTKQHRKTSIFNIYHKCKKGKNYFESISTIDI